MKKASPRFSRAQSTGPAPQASKEVVGLLHDLYAEYPGESHALLARALLQARKNCRTHAAPEAIARETGRVLGRMHAGKVAKAESFASTARS